MLIVLNGQPAEVPSGDLGPVLDHVLGHVLGLPQPAPGIAVAVNGEVVPRSSHATHRLRPDDRVDVVSAVPGG